jgi:hypothetical protein
MDLPKVQVSVEVTRLEPTLSVVRHQILKKKLVPQNPILSSYLFFVMCSQKWRIRVAGKKRFARNARKNLSATSQNSMVYCQGCGFFVDYENRTVGYSDEWTTASGLMTRLDISCSYCERTGVSTKFGDYLVLHAPLYAEMVSFRRRKKGKERRRGEGGEISFLH